MYPALAEAVAVARVAYWFEGSKGLRPDDSPQATYARWRFGITGPAVDPRTLPAAGRHLVWCGDTSSVDSPSEGLLAAFERSGDVSRVVPGDERYAEVDRALSGAVQTQPDLGGRMRASAVVNERLGQRWRAAARHGAVLLVGSGSQRSRSFRSLGNMVLLRTQPLRRTAVWLFTRVADGDRARFVRLQSGGTEHDPAEAALVARHPESVEIDAALDVAMGTRWSGDLRVAESIARAQLERAMGRDLGSPHRDWPERVSRASFEITQALVWQGRYLEADDQCRSGYMRVSGAKWTAWEFAMRAMTRFVHGEYGVADEQFGIAENILHLEGFDDFAPTIWIGRAACLRLLGDLDAAASYVRRVRRHPRKGEGSTVALVAEEAEQALVRGHEEHAREAWRRLCASSLPLWRAAGHLRLAENGVDRATHADAAADLFDGIGCRWGSIRTSVLRGETASSDLASVTRLLGPDGVFTPRGPWLA